METSEKSKNLADAANTVNGELQAVLRDLSHSRGELMLPETFTFASGLKMDSFPEKDVEKVIRDGVEKGEILFAVDPDFSGQVFEVKRVSPKEEWEGRGLVILALFPQDFIQRADVNGIRVNDAIRKCLARVIFEDIKIQAQRFERGNIKTSLTGLVGIFRGKIN